MRESSAIKLRHSISQQRMTSSSSQSSIWECSYQKKEFHLLRFFLFFLHPMIIASSWFPVKPLTFIRMRRRFASVNEPERQSSPPKFTTVTWNFTNHVSNKREFRPNRWLPIHLLRQKRLLTIATWTMSLSNQANQGALTTPMSCAAPFDHAWTCSIKGPTYPDPATMNIHSLTPWPVPNNFTSSQ